MRQRSESALIKAIRIHAHNHTICLIRIIIHVLLFLSGNRSSDWVLESFFIFFFGAILLQAFFFDVFSYISCYALHTKYPWHFSLCKRFPPFFGGGAHIVSSCALHY